MKFTLDKCVVDDEAIYELVLDIERRLNEGENIYLHCKGGHGRTGTVAALVISRIFKMDAWESLQLVQA